MCGHGGGLALHRACSNSEASLDSTSASINMLRANDGARIGQLEVGPAACRYSPSLLSPLVALPQCSPWILRAPALHTPVRSLTPQCGTRTVAQDVVRVLKHKYAHLRSNYDELGNRPFIVGLPGFPGQTGPIGKTGMPAGCPPPFSS